ncbi:MAG: hypothetical protein NTV51_18510, partial [Verrucomicrobia bacterium]|nr:hypothetical protein [Verrucomicrobiota bacterium]
MLARLMCAVAALLLSVRSEAEPVNPRFTGTPFLRTWSAEDYGAAPGNRCIAQHPLSGFIYIGNNTGVLEYDGVRWQLIRVPGRPTVRTLAIDSLGQIWTANDDTICRLSPDPRGELAAVPMRDRLPPDARGFRSAFTSLATPAGVFFGAARQLLFFPVEPDVAASAWPVPEDSPPIRLWLAENSPHWQLANRQVYRLRDNRVEPVPTPSAWLGGVEGTASPALHSLAAHLTPGADDGALDALRLYDGRLAVAGSHGLDIHDPAGRLLQHLDRSTGLPTNRVEALCEDREGGLWLALRNGLARLQLDAAYALHGPAQGLEGSPLNLGLARGTLYVSTGDGLMRRDENGHFHAVGQAAVGPRRVVADDDRIFIAGANLQSASADGPFRVIDERPHAGFLPLSTAPGVFVFGTPNGLWLGRATGAAWRRIGRCVTPTGPLV